MVSVRSSPVLVGRADELGELRQALDGACAGQPALVLVAGEAGIGKTRLLEQVAEEARSQGWMVLIGNDAPFVYGPLVGVLRDLRRELGDPALQRLVTGPRRPLAGLIPGLDPGSVSGQVLAQRPLFEAVLDLLARLSRRTPVLVGVENLHAADRSTRELVRFLAANLTDERVLLVVTSRTEDARDDGIGGFLAELVRLPRVFRVAPSNLTHDEVALQIEAILQARPGERLAERIAERSQGIPFYVEELLAAGGDADRMPADLEQTLIARLDGLSEVARGVLRAAAVLGPRPDDRLLHIVAGLSGADVDDGIEELTGRQLLFSESDASVRYRFRHDLIREVVHHRLPIRQRRLLHETAAQQLEADPELASGGSGRVHEELARHRHLADDPDRAFAASLAASEEATRAHGLSEALAHLERALDLWDRTSPDARQAVGARYELHHRCAQLAQPLADPITGLEHADRALAEPDVPAAQRAGLLMLRTHSLFFLGRRDEAEETLRRAQQVVPDEPSTWRATVLVGTAAHHVIRGRPHEALRFSAEAMHVADQVDDRARRAQAGCFHGAALVSLGRETEGIEHIRHALSIAQAIDDPDRLWGGHLALVNALVEAGRFGEAVEAGTEGLRRASRTGVGASEVEWLSMSVTEALILAGRWQEAERTLNTLRSVARSMKVVDQMVATTIAPLRLGQGRLDEAGDLLSGVADQLDRPSHPQALPYLLAYNAELALAEGRYDDTRDLAERACLEGRRIMTAEGQTTSEAALYFDPTLAHAIRAEANRAQQARDRNDDSAIADARRQATTFIRTLTEAVQAAPQGTFARTCVTAALTLGQAELTRLEGQPDPDVWQTAVTTAQATGIPHRAAYARFRLGEALLSREDRQAAAQALTAARRTATELGAQPLQDQIDALIRRARLRTDHTQDDGRQPRDLTPRENDVHELLVQGRTNRQIAAALYITEKTVEQHVTNILRKLHVHNRTEAAAMTHTGPRNPSTPPPSDRT